MGEDFSYPYYDPEFDSLYERIHGPPCIVGIDNKPTEDCTIIKINSDKKRCTLLDMIQVLTESDFQIIKSYISSDNRWCMNAFHVRDEQGNKLTNEKVNNYVQQIEMMNKGLQGRRTFIERRFSMRDFDCSSEEREKMTVSVDSCNKRGYTIVNIECKDHSKLMFDIVCTLTDMNYEIFHAYTNSHAGYASQEYFIKHINGSTLNTTSEKERLIKFIKAAIKRRVYE